MHEIRLHPPAVESESEILRRVITALKLGAKEVWGTDLDENAITAVGENLADTALGQRTSVEKYH